MQDAGAAAIELNMYDVPGDPRISGRTAGATPHRRAAAGQGRRHRPVAVKLSPFFSSIGEMAQRLDKAGADALVLFNRFLQPDIDAEELAVVPHVTLSSQLEGRLPRMCIALLRERVRAALAATSGVETPDDVAAYLLAGADVVMTASALLRHGPEYAAVLLDGLTTWMSAQRLPDRRPVPRHARGTGRHRWRGLRARQLCQCNARGERRCIRDVLSRGGSQPEFQSAAQLAGEAWAVHVTARDRRGPHGTEGHTRHNSGASRLDATCGHKWGFPFTSVGSPLMATAADQHHRAGRTSHQLLSDRSDANAPGLLAVMRAQHEQGGLVQ